MFGKFKQFQLKKFRRILANTMINRWAKMASVVDVLQDGNFFCTLARSVWIGSSRIQLQVVKFIKKSNFLIIIICKYLSTPRP